MMKFSEETLAVLKNFAAINPNLMLHPGNILRTVSVQKSVLAQATISESIPSKAAIYDMTRFLSTLGLFQNPDVQFGEEQFTIQSGTTRVKYTYAAENMLVVPPAKNINIPSMVDVDVKWSDIQSVTRAAGVLSLSEINFSGTKGTILMSAVDSKNPTADRFDVEVATGVDCDDFEMLIKVENMRLMPFDYKVGIADKVANFRSENVEYWIAAQFK